MVVAWPPEVTSEAHWLDVVHDRGDRLAHDAQRMLGEVRLAVAPPLRCVVPRLLVTARVHRLTLKWVRHPRH